MFEVAILNINWRLLMTKSLHKVLFLTVATTALSTIPSYSSSEDPLTSGAPKSTVTAPVVPANSTAANLLSESAPAPRTAPVVSTGCGCSSGISAWFRSVFTRQNIQAAETGLTEAANLTAVGLSVAGAATGNSKLTNAATGIGAGVKVVSTLDGDLSGGITAASATQALQDTAKGVGTIASVSAPGIKAAAQVAKIAGETSDVTGVLLPGGKLTTASALSAGAAIASDVGGKGGTTAAAVLSAVSAAEQAQQGVQTAVNSANPLPSTNA